MSSLASTFACKRRNSPSLPSSGSVWVPSVVYRADSGGGQQSVRITLAPNPAAKRPTAPVPDPSSTTLGGLLILVVVVLLLLVLLPPSQWLPLSSSNPAAAA